MSAFGLTPSPLGADVLDVWSLMLLELLLKCGGDHAAARRVGGPRADAEDAGRTEVLLRAGTPHQTVVALKRT